MGNGIHLGWSARARVRARALWVGALVLAGLPGVGSAVALGQGGAGEVRDPAKLEVARNTIDRGDRRLDVLAPITKRASGKVEVELHAAGERYRFDAVVNSAKGYVRFDKRIPRAQARLGTGIVTITYPGNARTRGQEVRLRAAGGKARLDAQRPELQAVDGQLRLRSEGELSSRARGVVRVQLDWVDAAGSNRSYETNAKIDDGKWRLSEALPDEVAQSVAGRRSTVHSYTLFTGYLRVRMRGEMEAYQVLPAPPPVVMPSVGPLASPAPAPPAPPPPAPPPASPGEGTVAPDRETTISSGGFSLTVPPGVVDQPADASVRPVGEDGDDLTGPAALFHIDASWEDGTKRVRLTMPIDPALQALGADYAPAVVHYLDNGEKELFAGQALSVDRAAGTVSFETTSLSKFRSWSVPRAWFYFTSPNPASQGSLVRDLFGRFVVGTRLVSPPSCNPDITDDSRVSTSGSAFEPDALFGNAPAIQHCVASREAASGEPERGRWVLANNTGAVLSYTATSEASVVNFGSSGDALSDMFFANHNATFIDGPDQAYSSQIEVPPGGSVAVTVPAGSSGGVDFAANAGLLIPSFVLRQLGDLVDAGDVSDLYQALNDCGYSLAQSQRSLEQLVSALRCAKTAAGIARTKLAKLLEKPLLLATAALTVSDQLTRRINPVNAALAYASAGDPGGGEPSGELTERVSVSTTGAQANSYSSGSSVSADGRFVAFDSGASNLVTGDTNGSSDVFVHDRSNGATERVSVDSAGGQADNSSIRPSVSADGRFVAFESNASNLVAGDTNPAGDVFVHDRSNGATERVSVDSAGAQANDGGSAPSVSADGRFVAFRSGSSNLVAGDTNASYDVFVHDRSNGATERVSVDSAGAQANSYSSGGLSVSADGRFVAFESQASNLVAGDTNDDWDVFVHDRSTGATQRVSVDSADAQANSYSFDPSVSADGRFVAFESQASNLVAGDTNGSDDVFVHDRSNGATERVSVDSAGGQVGGGGSFGPSVSADGRFVAFGSWASSLVAGDTNRAGDVFVHDRSTGATQRVSVDSADGQANGLSSGPSVSADGRFVAFGSRASNLVAGDTNDADDVFVRDRGAP